MLCAVVSMQVCNSIFEFTHGRIHQHRYIEVEVEAWSPASNLGKKTPTLMYVTFHDNEFMAFLMAISPGKKTKAIRSKGRT